MADEVRMENVAIHCVHLVCVHFIGFLSAKAGSCVVVFGQGEPKELSSAQPEAYDNSALPFKSCISVGLGSIFSENSLCVPLIEYVPTFLLKWDPCFHLCPSWRSCSWLL